MKSTLLLFILLQIVGQCGTKRSGGGGRIPVGRGSSASRTSNMRLPGAAGGWNRGTQGGGGWNRGTQGGGGWNRGVQGGFGNQRGTWGSPSRSKPTSSRSKFGSVLRSNQFKNAIVGAAAGYLTYQAGKALIRSAIAPMMWNNRHYYWDSRYYRGMGSGSHMCRMPIDSTDSQLGNVYFEDGTSRPREIVWSCSYYEYCCGYECCSRGSSSFWGIGLGIILLVGLCGGFFLCSKFCRGTTERFLPSKNLRYQPPGQFI